jgi:L-ribulose-5-phosphate 3-epimerase
MIWWGYFEDNPNPNKNQNPNLAREQGLFVENIHTPFVGVNNLWCDNLAGQDYANSISSCIDDCVDHEIPTMVVHLSSGNNSPPVSNIGLYRMMKIVDKAEQKGINIALENLRKPEYLRCVFDNINSERLKFCFDSGHQNCRTPNEDFLWQYGDKLVALHLHDNEGLIRLEASEDQHCLPFDCTIDWYRIMRNLKQINYQGSVALEITNLGYEHLIDNPLEFLLLAFDRVKRLQRMIL